MHQLHQILLRGADHPDINVNLMILANATESAVVKKTQQFGLHAWRHLTNLIQQHRTPVSLFKEAFFTFRRMTKQFAFNRIFRNGGAVQCQIRFCRTRACQVTGMGEEIFTGSGIAGNQQWRAQRSQLTSLLYDMLHFRADGDNLAKRAQILGRQILQLTPHSDGGT